MIGSKIREGRGAPPKSKFAEGQDVRLKYRREIKFVVQPGETKYDTEDGEWRYHYDGVMYLESQLEPAPAFDVGDWVFSQEYGAYGQVQDCYGQVQDCSTAGTSFVYLIGGGNTFDWFSERYLEAIAPPKYKIGDLLFANNGARFDVYGLWYNGKEWHYWSVYDIEKTYPESSIEQKLA